ncbi:cell division protein ZapA [Portibacter marinus]|uniref:cell division protein ZapA n=1 Tax=Portibacter marinus TaxID=2898660 RepID=UPI001F415E9E|nr:cell division protein ZapA [Portibacter marinus]
MSEKELKRIIITIAGRTYPVKVSDKEEAVMRKIEKDINDKINSLQVSYEGKDVRDYMSLAIISYAYDLNKARNPEEKSVLSEKLDQIEALLE